jgi:histidinol-phosphate phosphatase family domain/HAD-superfamily hydrolase, subfamily IIIA
MKRIGIFLDKDGTLLEDVPYNVAPERMHMVPRAEYALALLARTDADLFIISNQPGVALGYFPMSALAHVHAEMNRLFAQCGARLSGFYFCPHHPDGVIGEYALRCDCRKPAPGLILQAATENDIDLSRSWMIGDILHDIEAGRRAGCGTVLIDNGNETEWQLTPMRRPDYIASDLEDAVRHIMRRGTGMPV